MNLALVCISCPDLADYIQIKMDSVIFRKKKSHSRRHSTLISAISIHGLIIRAVIPVQHVDLLEVGTGQHLVPFPIYHEAVTI